jgi:hypothetical protein
MVVDKVNKERRREGANESTRLKKKQAVRKEPKPHLIMYNYSAIVYNMKINLTWNIEFLCL